MNNRAKNAIVVTLITLALIVLHFLCGLFTPYSFLTAVKDIVTGNPKLLQYGEYSLSDKQAIEVAPKYGFTYKIITSHITSKPLENGMRAYNSVIAKYISYTCGSNWENQFDYQVDSLFRLSRVDTMRKTILTIDRVKAMNDYLDSISDHRQHVFIWVLPQNKNEPNVRVGQIMSDSSIRVYDYYSIDPYTLKYYSVQH